MKNMIFNFLGSNYSNSWISYLLYGFSLIVGGLIILFFPEILVAMIATIFFVVGAFIIAISFQIRRNQDRYRTIRININD